LQVLAVFKEKETVEVLLAYAREHSKESSHTTEMSVVLAILQGAKSQGLLTSDDLVQPALR
jgi:hypothetical protein